ncbi:hypothetical protein T07_752 [Trichinella nelsoni]|uniref:Uncharacterized protein n=1 Tax=Trichinella nelsoni TaxID=6336 RepID=A0A0V0REL8_9BILA|nr:hypothetical protein T07_752 [Trichinella nelsoni]
MYSSYIIRGNDCDKPFNYYPYTVDYNTNIIQVIYFICSSPTLKQLPQMLKTEKFLVSVPFLTWLLNADGNGSERTGLSASFLQK